MSEKHRILCDKIEESLHQFQCAIDNEDTDLINSLDIKVTALYEIHETLFGHRYVSLQERRDYAQELEEPIDYAYNEVITMNDLA